MISLARTVPVLSFDAEATVAVGRDRPEMLAVAQLAKDLGRPIGARDVLDELLGALPEVLGWRVIERCVALKLLLRDGNSGPAALSESGRMALEHGEVLVPEEGTWRFFFVSDPLIPAGLIHTQRLEVESARSEREMLKEGRGAPQGSSFPHQTPEPLRKWCNELPRKSVTNGRLFQLQQVGKSGLKGPDGQLELEFTWDDEPRIRLLGKLRGGGVTPRSFEVATELDLPDLVSRLNYDVIWKALVSFATRRPVEELER